MSDYIDNIMDYGGPAGSSYNPTPEELKERAAVQEHQERIERDGVSKDISKGFADAEKKQINGYHKY